MKISARNQFAGVVTSVKEGAVNGVVSIETSCGKTIKADITMEAIRELGLAEGVAAVAIVKASNVMFAASAEKLAISARNQFPGKIVKVEKGAVNGRVTLETACGLRVSGSITNEAIDDLGLVEGADALAFVKSTDVMVGIEE
ncbi:MAG: TOBE domain-containing protein [Coriobacteriales bacterium]|nr:TOBE domain-containing protein [Coriobacteriales bacterium]